MASTAPQPLDSKHLGRAAKLQLADGTEVTGRLQSVEADSLMVGGAAEPQRVYLANIREVSVRIGSERAGGRAGLLLGAAAGLLGMQTCECDSLAKIFQSTNLWALVAFMLLGALIGRLLGRLWKKWLTIYPVRLPQR